MGNINWEVLLLVKLGKTAFSAEFSTLANTLIYIIDYLKNDNLKYTEISQRRSFYFSCYFTFFHHLFLLKLSCIKKHHVYNLYHISYISGFYYVIYYIVSEICIGGPFLEDCFYCYSQQITSAVAKEFLIPCKLIQGAPET